MKCEDCKENDARYVNIARMSLCSLCDMKRGILSLRLIDLPLFLELVGALIDCKSKAEYDDLNRQIERLYSNRKRSGIV